MNQLRFEVSPDGEQTFTVRPAAAELVIPAPIRKLARPSPKPVEVHDGSVVVQIFPQRTKFTSRSKAGERTARSYRTHLIVWHDITGRHRERRGSLERAKARAQDIARAINNGQAAIGNLTAADHACYLRSRELVAPTGQSLELAASIYTECVQILGGRASPAEACREYAAAHPAGVADRKVADVIAEFLARRKLSAKYRRILTKMLKRFSTRFDAPFSALTARDVDLWLDSLKLGLRSRRNYLQAIRAAGAYARRKGYVAATWSTLDQVENPEPGDPQVNIYTPDELVRLLNKAEGSKAGRKLVPLIAISAFCGVRHGEMNEEKLEHLDWADFDWLAKRIYVQKGAAKTGKDRIVDMPENLVAWLLPYKRPMGRICPLKRTSVALCRLRKRAGIIGPKKNSLRKSFISYKLALTRSIDHVADQAGNSARIIRANYNAPSTRLREAAERWFSIIPQRADVLPLFVWAQKAR